MSAILPGPVCAWLRARGAYGCELDEVPWTSGDSPVEGCFCLRTIEPFGPDDHLVHAHRCQPIRPCFEARAAPRPDLPTQLATGGLAPEQGAR